MLLLSKESMCLLCQAAVFNMQMVKICQGVSLASTALLTLTGQLGNEHLAVDN